MKFLKILLIIIGVILLVGIIMGLTGPKSYQVERTAVISASPDVVWPYAGSAEAFQEWSPFRKMDTTARVEFFGTPNEVGSGFKWQGKDSGKGESTYTVLEPGKAANTHLKFYTPFGVMETDSYMNLEPDPAGTKLTWGIKGDNNFIQRIMGSMSDMDEQMGPVFEGGLRDLDTLVITRRGIPSTGNKIVQVEYPGGTFLGVRGDVQMSDITSFYGKNLPLVMMTIEKEKMQMAGMPSGLYYTWDEEKGMTSLVAGIGVQGDVKAPSGMEVVKIAPGRAVLMQYMGGYNGLGSAHMELENYFKSNNLEQMAPVIEEYVTDPGAEPDSNKWITKITYLIK